MMSNVSDGYTYPDGSEVWTSPEAVDNELSIIVDEEDHQPRSVEMMATVLKVSQSGYYKWLNRSTSERKQENGELIDRIKTIQERARCHYGSPRITQALRRRGYQIGENRVAGLMRSYGLGWRLRKRFPSSTDSEHSLPIAENLLKNTWRKAWREMNKHGCSVPAIRTY